MCNGEVPAKTRRPLELALFSHVPMCSSQRRVVPSWCMKLFCMPVAPRAVPSRPQRRAWPGCLRAGGPAHQAATTQRLPIPISLREFLARGGVARAVPLLCRRAKTAVLRPRWREMGALVTCTCPPTRIPPLPAPGRTLPFN